MKSETPRIIRVVMHTWQTRVRGCGWYSIMGRLTVYTVREGRRFTVAEFDNDLVAAVIDTTAEPGKAAE